MNDRKEEALIRFGLTQREIRVYLAALMIGATTANSIAKYAKIERTSTYDILRSLMEKGIASQVTIGKKKCFEVANPETLASILDETKRAFQEALPELKALAKMAVEKPEIRLYEGKAGIKTIIHDVYREGKNFEVYANSGIMDFLGSDFEKLVNLRVEKMLFARIIHEKSKKTRTLAKTGKNKFREVRFLENFSLPSATFIYANKVAMFNFSQTDAIGVVIKNKDIAETQRKVFEKLWLISKK